MEAKRERNRWGGGKEGKEGRTERKRDREEGREGGREEGRKGGREDGGREFEGRDFWTTRARLVHTESHTQASDSYGDLRLSYSLRPASESPRAKLDVCTAMSRT
jgi:hypothetical protein